MNCMFGFPNRQKQFGSNSLLTYLRPWRWQLPQKWAARLPWPLSHSNKTCSACCTWGWAKWARSRWPAGPAPPLGPAHWSHWLQGWRTGGGGLGSRGVSRMEAWGEGVVNDKKGGIWNENVWGREMRGSGAEDGSDRSRFVNLCCNLGKITLCATWWRFLWTGWHYKTKQEEHTNVGNYRDVEVLKGRASPGWYLRV